MDKEDENTALEDAVNAYNDFTFLQLHEARGLADEELKGAKDLMEVKKLSVTVLDAAILKKLQAEGVDHSTIRDKRYEIRSEDIPTVSDWDALYAWINQHAAPMLLQRRISRKTWDEFIEGGESPEGVEIFSQTKLRVVKAR